ncbi:MAG: HNH endonuclease, partial [Candidatus Schmidhempelia sp.]|nr:HNH endonuclease [Candidatus Schmidhempelia sp.]
YLLYSNTLNNNDFECICRACEIYTFRMHGILRYRVDKNSKAILELSNQILKNNKSTSYIITQIGYLLNQSANLFDSISRLLSNELNYKSGINLIYYFLYELEIGLSSRSVKPIPWARADEDKKESIEHILPQSHRDGGWWENHWPDGLKAEQYVHRLGNLVITKGNQELGRKPIKLKLDDPDSSYFFNYKNATNSEKDIKKYTDGSTWKEGNILKRELDMINFAIERWSIPFKNDNGVINIPELYKEFVPNCKDIVVNFQDALCLNFDCNDDNSYEEY